VFEERLVLGENGFCLDKGMEGIMWKIELEIAINREEI